MSFKIHSANLLEWHKDNNQSDKELSIENIDSILALGAEQKFSLEFNVNVKEILASVRESILGSSNTLEIDSEITKAFKNVLGSKT